jgi:hypothetical protein
MLAWLDAIYSDWPDPEQACMASRRLNILTVPAPRTHLSRKAANANLEPFYCPGQRVTSPYGWPVDTCKPSRLVMSYSGKPSGCMQGLVLPRPKQTRLRAQAAHLQWSSKRCPCSSPLRLWSGSLLGG